MAEPRVIAWSDQIMAMIDDDIRNGWMPAEVARFSELHDFADANCYLIEANVPFSADPGGLDETIAVQDEVDARLAARAGITNPCERVPWCREETGHRDGCTPGAWLRDKVRGKVPRW